MTTKNTPLSLREIQLVELDILKRLVQIFEIHNIHYILCGGTMLGAVRHQGFIPWDDDIDILVPRDDYERLKSLARRENEKSQSLRLRLPGDKGNAYPFIKATDINYIVKDTKRDERYGSQNPAWYVVLILTLYIAYPFIHKSGLCVGDSKRLLICLLLIIILCYGWASLDLESYRLFESSLTRLPVFLLGCRFGSKVKRKDSSCLLLFSVVGILLFKLLQKVLPVEISGVSSRFMGSCLGLSICFLSAIVLEWIAQTASGRKAAIALGFFGKMSLETYLTHNLTKTIFYDLGMLSLNVYLIIVLCSIVISIPLSRLRNKLYYAYRDSAPVNHAH